MGVRNTCGTAPVADQRCRQINQCLEKGRPAPPNRAVVFMRFLFSQVCRNPQAPPERAYRSTSENPLGGRVTYPSTLGALAGVFLAYALHFHSVGIERVACAVTSSQLRLLLGWVFRNLTGER